MPAELSSGLTVTATGATSRAAALEATAFQTREVVEAMEADSGIHLDVLRVDGGMTDDDLLMQFQADILARPVVRPRIKETTALGAAYAAGLAIGFFANTEELRRAWRASKTWNPNLDEPTRDRLYSKWQKAVYAIIPLDRMKHSATLASLSQRVRFRSFHELISCAGSEEAPPSLLT
jgi:glycerol kinase